MTIPMYSSVNYNTFGNTNADIINISTYKPSITLDGKIITILFNFYKIIFTIISIFEPIFELYYPLIVCYYSKRKLSTQDSQSLLTFIINNQLLFNCLKPMMRIRNKEEEDNTNGLSLLATVMIAMGFSIVLGFSFWFLFEERDSVGSMIVFGTLVIQWLYQSSKKCLNENDNQQELFFLTLFSVLINGTLISIMLESFHWNLIGFTTIYVTLYLVNLSILLLYIYIENYFILKKILVNYEGIKSIISRNKSVLIASINNYLNYLIINSTLIITETMNQNFNLLHQYLIFTIWLNEIMTIKYSAIKHQLVLFYIYFTITVTYFNLNLINYLIFLPWLITLYFNTKSITDISLPWYFKLSETLLSLLFLLFINISIIYY
ncbi:hypothetical protein K502DRAFT_364391, partial [Neoconidiobolus thromboides FSU 785]